MLSCANRFDLGHNELPNCQLICAISQVNKTFDVARVIDDRIGGVNLTYRK
jgi:hypothetical protein